MALTVPGTMPGSARAYETLGQRFRPVDVLILAYVAVVSAVALARLSVFPGCAWLLAANGLIVALVVLLNRTELGPFGQLLREIYPLILLLALYASLDLINGGGRVATHDQTVQRWEAALFGGQPSRDWWQRWPSAFWSTLLHGAYCSYYGIIALPAVLLTRRVDRAPLRRFVLGVITTFLICCLVFIFFPVAGPYYAFPRPTGAFVDNPMAHLVYAMLAGGSSYGAAFPSSHVAASVTATLVGWRFSRRLGLALLVPTTVLTVAVVYCQMHYAVDALAGLGVGAGVGYWAVTAVNSER